VTDVCARVPSPDKTPLSRRNHHSPEARAAARSPRRQPRTSTTPGFAPPYPITLWIYPDGTYWPECDLEHCSAFYYGGDEPAPDRKITILSTSDTVGSWADISIDFGLITPNTGTLSALVVDATTLRFTFVGRQAVPPRELEYAGERIRVVEC